MKIEMTTTLFSCRHLALFAALLGGVIAQGSGQGVAGSQSIQIPQAHQSTVYRDTNGVPHIVAESEVGAWYALGYEQARDALLWIQVTCKGAKGELTWAIGTNGITIDCAVKMFNTHGRLAAMSIAQRQSLFAPTNPSISANFYDNCVAFAAGADAYRKAVLNAPVTTPLTPERHLRNWLSSNALSGGQTNLAWVYQTPIVALDIAAQGAMTAALMSFAWPQGSVNSAGTSYGLTGGGDPAKAEPLTDPMAPESCQQWLDDLRQRLSVVPGAPSAFSGSNTFAWSGLYCQDAPPSTTTYAGLLGDPHQAVPLPEPNFGLAFSKGPNHLWFAHVKVTPPGASQPSLDLLGHFPHAAAAAFTSHNRDVAMGGTLGSPNYIDNFLLRLEEGAAGFPAQPTRFYSYYHDSTPPSNQSWRQVTAHSITVKRWDNMNVVVPYWRADSFGIIVPNQLDVVISIIGGPSPQMPVIYGEHIDPSQPAPRWRVGIPSNPERMRFCQDPQPPMTSPMVVALRAPIDTAVAGEDKHLQLLRDFWEIGHATQVSDLISKTNGAAYAANVCFVDRVGRTFSTVLSAIPQRGDDTQLFADQYRTLDKWAIYSRGFGPVPARHSDDRKFDWQFGAFTNPAKPSPLVYLPYATTLPPVGPFKPMTLQDQGTGGAFPPTSYPSSGVFRIESGFFTSACNDMVWGFSRKRDTWAFVPGPGLGTFANAVVDNQLFQWALDAGVAYATPVIGLEGPHTQQIVVSRFTHQANRVINGAPVGLPPLTPAQMREFVVTPELYREDSYVPPAGLTAYNPPLPTAVRQLREVVDNPSLSVASAESPLVTAQKELAFFKDLWSTLFSASWDNHTVLGASPAATLGLRDLWINGSVPSYPSLQNKVFWYDVPANPASIRWIELPAEFPLIDFYWPSMEVSQGVTAGNLHPNGLSNAELGTLNSLVNNTLLPWDPVGGAHYRNVSTSTGACLLEMMGLRYNGRTVGTADFGRHWVRLKSGQVEDGSLGWVPLTATGQIPGSVASLVQESRPWSSLRRLAFPPSQLGTLLQGSGTPVPYDALYDPSTGLVRATLGPSETNALVAFFLKLGNHYIDPQANNGNPSRKLARYEILGSSEAVFKSSGYPLTYPLTDGLQRLTAVRALLDTATYLQSVGGTGIPPYGQCFRARAYDHTGRVWPASPAIDSDCVGGGLRAVTWNEAADVLLDPGHVPYRGLQPKFLGLGGSISTMVALFPSVGQSVQSHFWSTPGQEVMTSDPARFNAHMNAFATNTLLPTHFDDFLSHIAWQVNHVY